MPLLAKGRPVLKTSLNAYSFNKLLNDAIRGRGEGTTLMKLLDFAAKNKFERFDATGYYFPGYPAVPPESYIDGLRKKAADLGIGISGTGVRNNFTTADAAVRQQGVDHIKQYVEVAARLGAPVIRVFADTQMRAENWESVLQRRHPRAGPGLDRRRPARMRRPRPEVQGQNRRAEPRRLSQDRRRNCSR